MTQTPAAAPVVPLHAQSLDLTPGAAPPVVQQTAIVYTGQITVGKYNYTLVTILSALDMTILQNAQESGNFLEIIKAVPRLVIPEHRKPLEDYLLSDPVSDADKITLDDVLKALSDGLEQISARPTDK